MRSAIPSTSGSRWLTYAMPTPARLCSKTSACSLSTSSGPSAVVGSSSRSAFGRASRAFTTSSNCRSASESDPAGALTGTETLNSASFALAHSFIRLYDGCTSCGTAR